MRGGQWARRYPRLVPYEVSTPVFEGPFDLLLHLITKQQVDLYEVSLSSIIDAYLVELERLGRMDLEVATEFVLIAATLIELKTRWLLPGRDTSDLDEELAVWEQRDLLLARLLDCKTFKDAAHVLERMAARASRSFPRASGLEERFLALAPDLLEGVTPQQLHAAMVRALTPRPVPRVDLDHVAPVRASVRDAVDELVVELPELGATTFRRLTEGITERLAVIVRFLAVLELYKQGMVELEQATSFGELQVVWLGHDVGEAALVSVDSYEG